jgi:hypothetical protein
MLSAFSPFARLMDLDRLEGGFDLPFGYGDDEDEDDGW